MKMNGNKCTGCKARLAPGDGCDTYSGFYCDHDIDRICPRCGSYMPPVAVYDFDIRGCEKCSRSSMLPMAERKRDAPDRLIEKLGKRIAKLKNSKA